MAITCMLINAQGCSTLVAERGETHSESVSPDFTVEINATLDQKGVAKPYFHNGAVSGYDFKSSFIIPAVKGQSFGFSYNASAGIDVIETQGSNKQVKAKVQKSMPVTVVVTHPQMVSTDGQVMTESSWKDMLYMGRPNYVVWNFETDAELVSGKWTVAVFDGDRELISQNFMVRKMLPKPGKISEVCAIDEGLYPPHLVKSHTLCCSEGDAKACYDFGWKGVERLGDKAGAVLYYAKACDLGDISGCRMAGKLAKDEEEKSKWYNKGCDLNDLDSCLEVDRQLP
ncbi:DUF3859 domain-containing protein [uncultured Shewanella sp.]|uniref:DUF3859 domain-containing protein n=1 Tax=Shewanella atlantica TaxID=271099 RepID=UPI0026288B80|nr:DUF3859 domain-containing protein [uncultured Shewanella sp.]